MKFVIDGSHSVRYFIHSTQTTSLPLSAAPSPSVAPSACRRRWGRWKKNTAYGFRTKPRSVRKSPPPSLRYMKKIKLTRGQYTIVDDEDFDRLSDRKWHAAWSEAGQCFYASGWESYLKPDGKKTGRGIRMHRFLKGLKHGDKRIIDHINHNTLDNRQKNLRICTVSENQQNRRRAKNNTSGVVGVRHKKETNRFHARIYLNGRCKHLGSFKTLKEAVAVRKKAEIKYFGEYRSSK